MMLNNYGLSANVFRLDDWLAIFHEHGNDFVEIFLHFVKCFPLCVRTGKTWNVSYKKTRLRAFFQNCCKGSHVR